MKISKLFLGLTAAAVIALSTVGAKAYAADNTCTVDGTPLGKWGSYLTVNDRKITADFVVKGENCTITMSLVTWRAPAADAQPLYEQKLYDYTTQTLSPGAHQMTTNLPDCYYQADLMVGTKANWAEADNTPKKVVFPAHAGDPFPDMGLRDFKIGGDQKCVEPTPTPPKVLPTSTTTTPAAPTALTDTGASVGTILAIGSSVALLGAFIHQVILRKRFLS